MNSAESFAESFSGFPDLFVDIWLSWSEPHALSAIERVFTLCALCALSVWRVGAKPAGPALRGGFILGSLGSWPGGYQQVTGYQPDDADSWLPPR